MLLSVIPADGTSRPDHDVDMFVCARMRATSEPQYLTSKPQIGELGDGDPIVLKHQSGRSRGLKGVFPGRHRFTMTFWRTATSFKIGPGLVGSVQLRAATRRLTRPDQQHVGLQAGLGLVVRFVSQQSEPAEPRKSNSEPAPKVAKDGVE